MRSEKMANGSRPDLRVFRLFGECRSGATFTAACEILVYGPRNEFCVECAAL